MSVGSEREGGELWMLPRFLDRLKYKRVGIWSEVLAGKMRGAVWELVERGLWEACGAQ